jgi:hypothetical protein
MPESPAHPFCPHCGMYGFHGQNPSLQHSGILPSKVIIRDANPPSNKITPEHLRCFALYFPVTE